MSRQKQAVTAVLAQSVELRRKVLPYIDLENQSIDFERLLREQDLSDGLYAAVVWLRAIWTSKNPECDLIELSYALDSKMRSAVLSALKILWSD